MSRSTRTKFKAVVSNDSQDVLRGRHDVTSSLALFSLKSFFVSTFRIVVWSSVAKPFRRAFFAARARACVCVFVV